MPANSRWDLIQAFKGYCVKNTFKKNVCILRKKLEFLKSDDILIRILISTIFLIYKTTDF